MSAAEELLRHSHRVTVDEYHRMAELGLLASDSRVELIEGVVVDMAPMGPRHGGRLNLLNRLFNRMVGDRAIVQIQVPLRLDEHSEPEPDVALLKPRDDFYEGSHATATDCLLVIELCETTLSLDRKVKVPLYASHGIPELWLLDLKGGELHVYHTPSGGAYAHVTTLKPPGTVTLTALPDIQLDLDDLFRPRR